MKIGLLALETGRKVGGLEVYETNLIRALARVDANNEYHVFCLDQRVPELLGIEAPNVRYHVLSANRYKGLLWDVPRAMDKAALDLFHAFFVPPPFTSVPYVFTHHGTEVIERPEFYPFALGLRMRLLFRRAFDKAGMIICVSNYVKDYLANVRGIPPGRLRTIYSGCRPEFQAVERARARSVVEAVHGITTPYILNVGRIEPRKNPIRVLEAYARFRQSICDPPVLVFAGMKTWSAREFDRAVKRLGLEDSVLEVGHVASEELPPLYAGAEFVVFASLWEGFGMPALEAHAAGAPLISSASTSLPEVSAGASLLVDPLSVEEIAEAMCRMRSDERLREELVRKGIDRAASFTWERTARETIAAYETLNRLRANARMDSNSVTATSPVR